MDFAKIFDMQGFDFAATPCWQMVPVGGDRYLTAGDAKGLTFRSTHPSIVSVQEISVRDLPKLGPRMPSLAGDRCIRLRGVSKGAASILACDGPKEIGRLDVDTKYLKQLGVAFNFVKDKGGVKTVRVPAEAAQWVRELNWVYQQCNVKVACRSARYVSVDIDLGWVIPFIVRGTPKENQEWNSVVSKYDASADVNIFHFNDVRLGKVAVDNADALTWGKCCMIDDAASNYVKTLAHEIGHTQGLPDRGIRGGEHDLMATGTGVNMTRADVNLMNP